MGTKAPQLDTAAVTAYPHVAMYQPAHYTPSYKNEKEDEKPASSHTHPVVPAYPPVHLYYPQQLGHDTAAVYHAQQQLGAMPAYHAVPRVRENPTPSAEHSHPDSVESDGRMSVLPSSDGHVLPSSNSKASMLPSQYYSPKYYSPYYMRATNPYRLPSSYYVPQNPSPHQPVSNETNDNPSEVEESQEKLIPEESHVAIKEPKANLKDTSVLEKYKIQIKNLYGMIDKLKEQMKHHEV